MPLATCLRLAPHQLREIRKSTGKLISKETMPLTPALPLESQRAIWEAACLLVERGQTAFPEGGRARRGVGDRTEDAFAPGLDPSRLLTRGALPLLGRDTTPTPAA